MGKTIGCAECHVHPFDKVKRYDFHGLNAFFQQNGQSVYEQKGGDVVKATPTYFGRRFSPSSPSTQLAQLSRELTADPLFAKTLVNHIWTQMFGRSLNHPDLPVKINEDLSVTEFPDLLDMLAERFTEKNYDQNVIMSAICKSKAYQSHQELLYPGKQLSFLQFMQAMRLPKAFATSEDLGIEDDVRKSVRTPLSIQTFLYLMNNEAFNMYIKTYWDNQIKKKNLTIESGIRNAFLFILGRPPTKQHLSAIKEIFAKDPTTLSENLTYITISLVTSHEFFTY